MANWYYAFHLVARLLKPLQVGPKWPTDSSGAPSKFQNLPAWTKTANKFDRGRREGEGGRLGTDWGCLNILHLAHLDWGTMPDARSGDTTL